MDTTDAYFAGLIDGERCIHLQSRYGKRPNHFRATVEVNMTCKKTIDALHQRYGGSIMHKPPQKVGWKEQWRWKVQDASARPVIHAILPFMITKRDAAELLVDYWKERGLW